jgi:cation:H+ antiporter
MDYVYLAAGFVLLVTSGNYLVKSGVSLARHLHVSTMVIAVTVISMGTSAPELVVSVKAVLSQYDDISIGNVIGSNISNIALVLAITGIIIFIPVEKITVSFDWPVMMASGILLYIFMLDGFLVRWEGIVLLVLLAGYVFYSLYNSRKAELLAMQEKNIPQYKLMVSLLIIIISSFGLVVGANWLIEGSVGIAEKIGVSERVISVSLIAFGTSVPELATSVMAIVHKETDISIGNIIGSNIFNVLGILGVASIVGNISINPMTIRFDVFWMLGFFILLFIFILPHKGKMMLSRMNSLVLLFLYIVYIYLIYKLEMV